MPESNLDLFKRWFEQVWNQRRTATIAELFAPNGISHGVAEDGSDLIGPQAFLPFHERFLNRLPRHETKSRRRHRRRR